VPKPQGWEFGLSNAEMKMLSALPSKKDTCIFIGLPHSWPLALAQKPKHFVGFCVYEGTRIPKDWIRIMGRKEVEQVWVPSEHTRSAVFNAVTNERYSFIKEKVRVVPHGVDHSIFQPQSKTCDEFVFCANKGWRRGIFDRGGLQFVFLAFSQEFAAEEKVLLRVKINPCYAPHLDWNEEIKKLGVKEVENIQVCADSWPKSQLARAYAGDCFVSPTMGEAFGLPGLEAHACGLPTIQTAFGGQLDYMSESSDWMLGYDLVPAPFEANSLDQMYEGDFWAKPRIDLLRQAMREAFEKPEICKKKAQAALESAKGWSWRNSAKKGLKYLEELR
jgi:glycosyltransferase involved in cell wall biosynthesis